MPQSTPAEPADAVCWSVEGLFVESRSPIESHPVYPLIAALYVSQAIPLGFFTVALPAILRSSGVGVEAIGLLGALALPWLLKLLWAPLVDGFGSRRRGHYRSWILPLQTLSVACVLVIAILDVRTDLALLAAAGAAFMFLAATQDIATDGLAVRALGRSQRGFGNGIQVGGYYLGQILGGGAVLLVYGRFGWSPALVAMAAFLALPLVPALRHREPPAPASAERRRTDYRAIVRFFRRPGASVWVPILLLFRASEAMAWTMLGPMLVDLGHSLQQIALLLGGAGSAASLAGALLGGASMLRLGRTRSLILFGLLQTASVALLVALASGGFRLAAVYAVGMGIACAGGMASAALYTNMMDRSSPDTAATEFTLQQSLAAVGPILGASISGFSVARLGYPSHFALAALVGLATIILVARGLTVEVARRPAAPAARSAVSYGAVRARSGE